MVLNETLNETFEVAQGSIQYSPPPSTQLTSGIVLMIMFFVVILILYVRLQKSKKNKSVL